MSNLETYREKALECVRAADEIHGSRERVELLGLASVYMALADYVDRGHEHSTTNRGNQEHAKEQLSKPLAKSRHLPRLAGGAESRRALTLTDGTDGPAWCSRGAARILSQADMKMGLGNN